MMSQHYDVSPAPCRRLKNTILLCALGIVIFLQPVAANSCSAASQVSPAKQATERQLLDQAAKNIEEYRKGDVDIEILSAAGTPVAGAKISVHQVQHEFLFGCIAFSLVRSRPDEPLDKFKQRFLIRNLEGLRGGYLERSGWLQVAGRAES